MESYRNKKDFLTDPLTEYYEPYPFAARMLAYSFNKKTLLNRMNLIRRVYYFSTSHQNKMTCI